MLFEDINITFMCILFEQITFSITDIRIYVSFIKIFKEEMEIFSMPLVLNFFLKSKLFEFLFLSFLFIYK